MLEVVGGVEIWMEKSGSVAVTVLCVFGFFLLNGAIKRSISTLYILMKRDSAFNCSQSRFELEFVSALAFERIPFCA